MDLTPVAEAVAAAEAVVAVGARTQWEVGGRAAPAVEVRAPAGIVRHDPGDLTVTVGARTSFADLDAVLAPHRQECPLDPRHPEATIGGILATGLSGVRRLRHGPVREHVLELRFVTGDARVVKGGGPTVKNVTGYDLPRLLVGSLGTLGVIGQVTLRCRPRPVCARWFRAPPRPLRLFRPSAALWDGEATHVLLEGTPADIDAQAAGLAEREAPTLPDGTHRGRISVAPGRVEALGATLARIPGARWCAELGVGTVHVAGDDASVIAAARRAAHDHGGWLLRESGGDDDGFGRSLPNLALLRRIKAAFDPPGKLAPGRLPL